MKHIVIEGISTGLNRQIAKHLSRHIAAPFFQNECHLAEEKVTGKNPSLEKITGTRLETLRASSAEMAAGKTVIQAGFILQTAAEHAAGTGTHAGEILAEQKRRFPIPDLTILIDTPEDQESTRKTSPAVLKTMRRNYHSYLATGTVHSVVIDGRRPVAEIERLALTAAMHLLRGEPSKLDEAVFCVPRAILEKAGLLANQSGMIPVTDENLRAFKEALNEGIWAERALVEEDTSLKQIIPFVGVLNPADELSYYIRHGKDKRLHDKLSVGVSGHINPEDSRGFDSSNESPGWEIVMTGTLREIEEELGSAAEGMETPQVIGFINDDVNPVGRVHLGLAMTARSPKPLELFRSEELGILQTGSLSQLSKDRRAESWTKILLKEMIKLGRNRKNRP